MLNPTLILLVKGESMSRLIVLTCILFIGCGEEALYGIPDAQPEPEGQQIPNPEPEAETPEPPDQTKQFSV